jgi:hypothetical protein
MGLFTHWRNTVMLIYIALTALVIEWQTIISITGGIISLTTFLWMIFRGFNSKLSKKTYYEDKEMLSEVLKCKSDKDYVDSADKTLLMMIKEIQDTNKSDHGTIRTDIENRLKSMDNKLDILLAGKINHDK